MAVTRYNLTGDVGNLIAAVPAKPARVVLETNLSGGALIDTAGNTVQIGSLEAAVAADGTFGWTGLVASNSTDVNPTGVQYQVAINYFDDASRERKWWRSGFFDLTSSGDVADKIGAAAIPPQWQANFISTGLVDAKGDLLVGTANDTVSRLAVGSDARRLVADSTQTTGLRWVDPSENTTIDAKGDLLVGTASDTLARVAVGANGRFLVADSTQTAGVRWTSVSYFEGTGSPEGVVTAVVGATYVDTAATLGAIRWVKASGSGNTGWKVDCGDTGWRNLNTGGFVNGAVSASWDMAVRRLGGVVHLRYNATLAASVPSGSALYTMPSGFRISQGKTHVTGTASHQPAYDGSGSLLAFGAGFASTFLVLNDVYVTDDAWPTTLPGTPA